MDHEKNSKNLQTQDKRSHNSGNVPEHSTLLSQNEVYKYDAENQTNTQQNDRKLKTYFICRICYLKIPCVKFCLDSVTHYEKNSF